MRPVVLHGRFCSETGQAIYQLLDQTLPHRPHRRSRKEEVTS